nr:MAG TPA: hypothetical protein [Bacteriophage sp.]
MFKSIIMRFYISYSNNWCLFFFSYRNIII